MNKSVVRVVVEFPDAVEPIVFARHITFYTKEGQNTPSSRRVVPQR
jgi:hypothetical protein